MSKNIVTTTLAAFACAAVVSAQAPQTPQVPAPPSPAPAPTQRAPEAKAPAADSITLTGCVERSTSAAPGSVGTTGAAGGAQGSGFILTKVMRPTGTSGSSNAAAAPASSSYRLDADDSKLSGHVGHKVEIVGSLADRSDGPNASKPDSGAPRFKVSTVKMIAPSCTE